MLGLPGSIAYFGFACFYVNYIVFVRFKHFVVRNAMLGLPGRSLILASLVSICNWRFRYQGNTPAVSLVGNYPRNEKTS